MAESQLTPMSSFQWLVTALLFLSLTPCAASQTAQAPERTGLGHQAAERTAGADGALPQGALMRLGSVGLCQPGGCTCVALEPNNKQILASAGPDSICLWDITSGTRVGEIKARSSRGCLPSVAFHPDGRTLAVCGMLYKVGLWDRSGLAPDRSAPSTLLFSPDNRLLGCSEWGGSIVVWEIDSGRELLRIQAGRSSRFTFMAGGRVLAVASLQGIWLWNIAAAKPIGRLGVGAGEVLVLSPDGLLLVSRTHDKRLALWDVLGGQRLWSFAGHANPTAAVFSGDGRKLATARAEGTALLWDPCTLVPPEWPRAGGPLAAAQLDRLWAELNHKSQENCQALFLLAAHPEQAVELISTRTDLTPFEPRPRIQHLIDRLDDDNFDRREQATRALREFGPRARPELLLAARSTSSPEARMRIKKLLDLLPQTPLEPATPRELRIIQLLEWINSPKARELLRAFAADDPTVFLTEAARDALARLPERDRK